MLVREGIEAFPDIWFCWTMNRLNIKLETQWDLNSSLKVNLWVLWGCNGIRNTIAGHPIIINHFLKVKQAQYKLSPCNFMSLHACASTALLCYIWFWNNSPYTILKHGQKCCLLILLQRNLSYFGPNVPNRKISRSERIPHTGLYWLLL